MRLWGTLRPSWLPTDILAGLTLLAVAAPEQLATAHLAGMPPVTGLVAFVVGTVVFALLGTHRLLSVGADSTIAPVLAAGAVAAAVAPADRAAAVGLLSVLVGVVLVAVGVGRLAWLARFLSVPVTLGLLAGIAVVIVVHQLPAALGVPVASGGVPARLADLSHRAGDVDWRVVLIAVGVLASTLVAERISPRLPGALLAVAAATLVVWIAGLSHRGVPVVGEVGHGVAPIDPTRWISLSPGAMVAPVLIVVVLCLAQIATTEQSVPDADASLDRDLVAVGAASVLSAGAGSFAVNSSPPRTTLVEEAGGRSQVAGVVAAVGVVVLVLAGGPVLAALPEAALAGILLFVATRLVKPARWARVWRFDKREFIIAVVTTAAVAGWGIDIGVAVAVVLTLADHVRRQARPRDAVLGRVPGTDHWVSVDAVDSTEQEPGVLVYLLYAPVWFADADFVVSRVDHLVTGSAIPVRAVVFDADAVSDIDFTGAEALRGLVTRLRARGVDVAVARASREVGDDLRRDALVDLLGPGHVFPDVASAVGGVRGRTRSGQGPLPG